MIARAPAEAARREHDLIIIGGGIYGACLAWESARRGLRPLLLERGDFGAATSWNSLRILHGGLRYLQTLDLRRFHESVAERRWFCRTFPDLVRPQEFLMPLYDGGLKHPAVFRAALAVNDLLSRHSNIDVDLAVHLGRGRLLNTAETVSRFPLAERRGLRGSAIWYDAVMVSSQRILIEILRCACALGATALNYLEAVAPVRRGDAISAVCARDVLDGQTYTFASRRVCNCAGPWSAAIASAFDRKLPQLFPPSLAFNVLLDREAPCASAVAITPRRMSRRGPAYFMYPAFGGLLAGTGHVQRSNSAIDYPTEEELNRFLSDLTDAVPGLHVRREHVRRILSGLLPVTAPGTTRLAVQPVIWDHGRHNGPKGLISVSGVKFTTARLVAERTLQVLYGRNALRSPDPHDRQRRATDIDYDQPFGPHANLHTAKAIKKLAQEEAVMTVDDLVFRRTNWGLVTRDVEAVRSHVRAALGWNDTGAPRDLAGPDNATPSMSTAEIK